MNCNGNCRQGRDCNCSCYEARMLSTIARLVVVGFVLVIFFGVYLQT